MRQKISKRLEALEEVADREALADGLTYAIAYYLGGARHPSEAVHGYAKALNYKDLYEFCQGSADWLGQPPDSEANRRTLERIGRAQSQLFAKFGYDLRGASAAAFADAVYRITTTLPEEWLATIRSAHRRSCESEARVTQATMKLIEEYERIYHTRPRKGDPRQ